MNHLNPPFDLEEEKVDENWEPQLGQEYLILYDWGDDHPPNILVGHFSTVWFGYRFNWFWGASSLQLSTNDIGTNPDWKNFKRVFKLSL